MHTPIIRWILKVSICCLFLTISGTAFPQKVKNKVKPADYGITSKRALNFFLMGESFTQQRRRDEAIAAYNEALKHEPDFAFAHYRVGINAYVLKDYEQALVHLKKAEAIDPEYFNPLYIAEAYFYEADYESAIKYYTEYVDRGRGRKVDMVRAVKNLRNAEFAAKAIRNPIAFEPKNMGERVNSKYDEYLPFLTADDSYLLFTARRPDALGGYNQELRDYGEDFYFSKLNEDGEWLPAENLGYPINTANNEGSPSISQDGNTIYFTACNRIDGFGSCDLYVAKKDGSDWAIPENLGPKVNSASWDSHPYFSHDGKKLFFTSVRPGGLGGQDIWMCRWENGEWSEAENLGPTINTPGNESSPFLHADGKTLYFASDFHPGFGGADLFLSNLQLDGSWAKPVNLGYPLNTAASELNIFINGSGEKGMINSNREGGFGNSDLYEFVVDTSIRPKPATFLRGWVKDSLSGEPIKALINLVDLDTEDTLRQVYSNTSEGKFLMSLPLNRVYAASVQAPGYLFASKHFFLKERKSGDLYFDLEIALLPVKTGSEVVLQNIFFESGSYELAPASEPELRVMVKFLETNPTLQIEIQGHTDNVGSNTDNLQLSQKRADAVKDYLVQAGIETDRVNAKGYGEEQPIESNQTESGRAQNRRTAFKVIGE